MHTTISRILKGGLATALAAALFLSLFASPAAAYSKTRTISISGATARCTVSHYGQASYRDTRPTRVRVRCRVNARTNDRYYVKVSPKSHRSMRRNFTAGGPRVLTFDTARRRDYDPISSTKVYLCKDVKRRIDPCRYRQF